MLVDVGVVFFFCFFLMEIGWHQHVHFLLLIKRMICYDRERKFIDTLKSILHNLNYYLVFAEVILISKGMTLSHRHKLQQMALLDSILEADCP